MCVAAVHISRADGSFYFGIVECGHRRHMSLATLKLHHARTVLDGCHGNISQAARVLRIGRRSLQRYLGRAG